MIKDVTMIDNTVYAITHIKNVSLKKISIKKENPTKIIDGAT